MIAIKRLFISIYHKFFLVSFFVGGIDSGSRPQQWFGSSTLRQYGLACHKLSTFEIGQYWTKRMVLAWRSLRYSIIIFTLIEFVFWNVKLNYIYRTWLYDGRASRSSCTCGGANPCNAESFDLGSFASEATFQLHKFKTSWRWITEVVVRSVSANKFNNKLQLNLMLLT